MSIRSSNSHRHQAHPRDEEDGIRHDHPPLVKLEHARRSGSHDATVFSPVVLSLRSMYNYLLFKYPSHYFFLVAGPFIELRISALTLEFLSSAEPGVLPLNDRRLYEELKAVWNRLIDSLIKEWEILNLIAVLLLSAILAIVQIQAASVDPYTRYFALSALICALFSLMYGCIYSINFNESMRREYKVAEWIGEAQRPLHGWSVIWNVWVMLALPALYLTWSFVFFVCCIVAFLWRTGPDIALSSVGGVKGNLLRGLVSGILGLGFFQAACVKMTFPQDGREKDRAWGRRIAAWVEERDMYTAPVPPALAAASGGDPNGGPTDQFALPPLSAPRFATDVSHSSNIAEGRVEISEGGTINRLPAENHNGRVMPVSMGRDTCP